MYLCCIESLSSFQSNLFFLQIFKVAYQLMCLAHLACFVGNPACSLCTVCTTQ